MFTGCKNSEVLECKRIINDGDVQISNVYNLKSTNEKILSIDIKEIFDVSCIDLFYKQHEFVNNFLNLVLED